MNEETPKQFPSYAPQFASHAHAKIMTKLMGRALQGKHGKSIWTKGKRKKARIV